MRSMLVKVNIQPPAVPNSDYPQDQQSFTIPTFGFS